MHTWTNVRMTESAYGLPVVVSYFTDQFYLREAYELVRSCEMFDLEFYVKQVPDLGSWQANTNHKPTFLSEMSQAFPSRSLLWLDADARVRSYPTLLVDVQADIAYHMFRGREALSGTVFLKAGRTRTEILERWQKEVSLRPRNTDQVSMHKVVKEGGYKVRNLPDEYCWIFDLSNPDRRPDPLRTVIIEHMQSSRYSKLLSRRLPI